MTAHRDHPNDRASEDSNRMPTRPVVARVLVARSTQADKRQGHSQAADKPPRYGANAGRARRGSVPLLRGYRARPERRPSVPLHVALLSLVVPMVLACSPAQSVAPQPGQNPGDVRSSGPARTLAAAVRVEPASLGTRAFVQAGVATWYTVKEVTT